MQESIRFSPGNGAETPVPVSGGRSWFVSSCFQKVPGEGRAGVPAHVHSCGHSGLARPSWVWGLQRQVPQSPKLGCPGAGHRHGVCCVNNELFRESGMFRIKSRCEIVLHDLGSFQETSSIWDFKLPLTLYETVYLQINLFYNNKKAKTKTKTQMHPWSLPLSLREWAQDLASGTVAHRLRIEVIQHFHSKLSKQVTWSFLNWSYKTLTPTFPQSVFPIPSDHQA